MAMQHQDLNQGCPVSRLTTTVYCYTHAEPDTHTLFASTLSRHVAECVDDRRFECQANPLVEQQDVVRGVTTHTDALLHWHCRQGVRVCVQLCLYGVHP